MINEYKNFLKFRENLITEKAIVDEKIANIKRLCDINDIKSLSIIARDLMEDLKIKFKNFNIDDIILSYNKDVSDKNIDCYYIKYKGIWTEFVQLEEIRFNLIKKSTSNNFDDEFEEQESKENKNDLILKVFGDDNLNFNLEISIDKKIFNKIDIITSLPIFMKNLGLGKKIYKKFINKYGYISSIILDEEFNSSIDSDFVWLSLAKDKELFFFSKDDNFICFDNRYPFKKIETILLRWFDNIGSNYELDDDFLIKYKDDIEKSELKKLIKQ